jgi:hypothetical protein
MIVISNITIATDNITITTDNITTATDNITTTKDNITITTDNITIATDVITLATDIITIATDIITIATDIITRGGEGRRKIASFTGCNRIENDAFSVQMKTSPCKRSSSMVVLTYASIRQLAHFDLYPNLSLLEQSLAFSFFVVN